MKCFYCQETVESGVQKHNRTYHLDCYVAYVHDIMKVIELKAGNIVRYTQDSNARANSTARQIVAITEKF